MKFKVDAKWGVVKMRVELMKKVKDRVLSDFICGLAEVNPDTAGIELL